MVTKDMKKKVQELSNYMDMKMKIGQENMLMNTEAETLEIILSPAEEDDDIKQAAYEEAH